MFLYRKKKREVLASEQKNHPFSWVNNKNDEKHFCVTKSLLQRTFFSILIHVLNRLRWFSQRNNWVNQKLLCKNAMPCLFLCVLRITQALNVGMKNTKTQFTYLLSLMPCVCMSIHTCAYDKDKTNGFHWAISSTFNSH